MMQIKYPNKQPKQCSDQRKVKQNKNLAEYLLPLLKTSFLPFNLQVRDEK